VAKPLRIFISSPGDVVPERRRAALVIEKLAKVYARFFAIEPVLWEVEPMLASGHFEDHLIAPSATDIVVLIVWSRLGTPLPRETGTRTYCGIDGRVPVTGTEWEFEDALAAHRAHGAPDLLAYRKLADPVVSLKDKVAKAAAEEQWDKLNGFWDRWFVNQGEFRAAFSEFADLDGFEDKVESDLRRLIDRRTQAPANHKSGSERTWLAGSPFRGLDIYRFEHAPIFFGRSAMTKAAVEQLTSHPEDGRAFLLILGASGTGKSSLAQAGVLHTLTGRGIVPGVGLWRRAVMRSGNPKGPFAALAEALAAREALPELLTPRQDTRALERNLRASVDDPSYSIIGILDEIEVAARIRNDLLKSESTRLALVVDQLEELFTTGEIIADDRTVFIRCLDGLARSGRVLVIGTMRSDYWHRAAETPLLVEMAAGNRRLDLLAPTQDEIMEMIRQPAEAAGVEFENDPGNIRFDATLAKEASIEPGALPLLSFLLDELYKTDIANTGGSILTYASMKNLGGLKGAIAQQAEAVFATWPDDVRASLPRVLRALVTVSGLEAAPTARSAPMSRFPAGTAARRIVDALLDQQVRLLVAEGDGDGAQVRLAHEALITHWKTAREQIAKDRADLELRGRLEQGAALWRESEDESRLLGEGTPLIEAEQLLARFPDELGDEVTAFIQASRMKLAGRPRTIIFVDRDERLDLFMGFALWMIYLGHTPFLTVSWFNFSNFGFSDATEIFIFVSGYTMASEYYPVIRNHGVIAAVRLILARAWKGYVVYVFLFAVYLAEISYVSASFENPLYPEEMGILDFLKQPDVFLVQALLLKFQPANIALLPLYIVLLPAFPLFLWLLYRRPHVALGASVLLYCSTWQFDWWLQAYPVGTWYLNPFAWQLLFAFGAWCGFGGAAHIGRYLPSRGAVVLSTAYLLLAFAIVMTWHFPQLAGLIPRRLEQWMYPIDKTNLDLLRLAHFLALLLLAARFIPYNWPGLNSNLLRPLIVCGQHPLEVFCLGIFLSFASRVVLAEVSAGVGMQFMLTSSSIIIMVIFAALLRTDEMRYVSVVLR
jgi:hypothetical protein